MNKALLIMAHGSRSDVANDEFRQLVAKVALNNSQYSVVLPCFLELAAPSLMAAMQQVDNQPVEQVDLYPLFFNRGKHVGRDIPHQVAQAQQQYPHLPIQLLDYFGQADALPELLLSHISQQTSGHS